MPEGTTTAAPAAATATPAAGAPKTAPGAAKAPAQANGATPKPDAPEKIEETKTEPPAPPKRYKVKLDDAEEEVDEAELLRGYQKSRVSDKRFREAKQLHDQATQVLEALKTNPRQALRQLGLKPEQLQRMSEEELIERIQWEQMTPEQKRIAELEAMQRQYEADEQRRRDDAKKAEEEAERKKAEAHIDQEFQAALKDSGLPEDPVTIFMMAHLIHSKEMVGIPYTAQDAVADIRALFDAHIRGRFGSMNGDQLLDYLGDHFDKASTAKIARVRGQPKPTPKAFAPPPAAPKVTSEDDWNAYLARFK